MGTVHTDAWPGASLMTHIEKFQRFFHDFFRFLCVCVVCGVATELYFQLDEQ